MLLDNECFPAVYIQNRFPRYGTELIREILSLPVIRSEAGECSVYDKVRTCCEGTGVARKVYTDGFQFFRFSEAAHRSHRVPFLDQRDQAGRVGNRLCPDVSRADGVDADTALRPFDRKRLRQLDHAGFRCIVCTLRLRNIYDMG